MMEGVGDGIPRMAGYDHTGSPLQCIRKNLPATPDTERAPPGIPAGKGPLHFIVSMPEIVRLQHVLGKGAVGVDPGTMG